MFTSSCYLVFGKEAAGSGATTCRRGAGVSHAPESRILGTGAAVGLISSPRLFSSASSVAFSCGHNERPVLGQRRSPAVVDKTAAGSKGCADREDLILDNINSGLLTNPPSTPIAMESRKRTSAIPTSKEGHNRTLTTTTVIEKGLNGTSATPTVYKEGSKGTSATPIVVESRKRTSAIPTSKEGHNRASATPTVYKEGSKGTIVTPIVMESRKRTSAIPKSKEVRNRASGTPTVFKKGLKRASATPTDSVLTEGSKRTSAISTDIRKGSKRTSATPTVTKEGSERTSATPTVTKEGLKRTSANLTVMKRTLVNPIVSERRKKTSATPIEKEGSGTTTIRSLMTRTTPSVKEKCNKTSATSLMMKGRNRPLASDAAKKGQTRTSVTPTDTTNGWKKTSTSPSAYKESQKRTSVTSIVKVGQNRTSVTPAIKEGPTTKRRTLNTPNTPLSIEGRNRTCSRTSINLAKPKDGEEPNRIINPAPTPKIEKGQTMSNSSKGKTDCKVIQLNNRNLTGKGKSFTPTSPIVKRGKEMSISPISRHAKKRGKGTYATTLNTSLVKESNPIVKEGVVGTRKGGIGTSAAPNTSIVKEGVIGTKKGGIGTSATPNTPLVKEGVIRTSATPTTPIVKEGVIGTKKGAVGTSATPTTRIVKEVVIGTKKGGVGTSATPNTPIVKEGRTSATPHTPIVKEGVIGTKKGDVGTSATCNTSIAKKRGKLGTPVTPTTPIVKEGVNETPETPSTLLVKEWGKETSANHDTPIVKQRSKETPANPNTPIVKESAKEMSATPFTPMVEERVKGLSAAPYTSIVQERIKGFSLKSTSSIFKEKGKEEKGKGETATPIIKRGVYGASLNSTTKRIGGTTSQGSEDLNREGTPQGTIIKEGQIPAPNTPFSKRGGAPINIKQWSSSPTYDKTSPAPSFAPFPKEGEIRMSTTASTPISKEGAKRTSLTPSSAPICEEREKGISTTAFTPISKEVQKRASTTPSTTTLRKGCSKISDNTSTPNVKEGQIAGESTHTNGKISYMNFNRLALILWMRYALLFSLLIFIFYSLHRFNPYAASV